MFDTFLPDSVTYHFHGTIIHLPQMHEASYGAAIAFCAFIGAQLEPRLLDGDCRTHAICDVTGYPSVSNSLT